MNESVIEKIQKCLELARRGGTEGEMQAAMCRVQALLAKHNLTLEDVSSHETDAVCNDANSVRGVEVWHRYIYNSISKLYFCTYFFGYQDVLDESTGTMKRITTHNIVGRKSNTIVAKNVCSCIIDLGLKLAKELDGDIKAKNSFKKGFASRISERAKQQLAETLKSGIVESNSTALMVAPLYKKSAQENEKFLSKSDIKTRKARSKAVVSNREAFINGMSAAENVSLFNGISSKTGNKSLN